MENQLRVLNPYCLADVIVNVADGKPLWWITDVDCQLWLMEKPLNVVADVIATVADGMATCVGIFQYGRCYCQCGRWNSHWIYVLVIYFCLSSVMLFRTSSHMWGSWYLPMFLFRDGLLILMYIASFISLMKLWSSLPTILKLSSAMVWPAILLWS